jgi:hypothetical protein
MIPQRQPSSQLNQSPISTAVKEAQKGMPTRNLFAPLRTNEMDMETSGAENTLPEQEAPRKSDRPPPIVMTLPQT